MGGKGLTVFLDTMIFLHFRPLEELDLAGLLSEDEVKVVIPRITVRELDKHKNTHGSEKIRERARRALQKIESWSEQEVRVRKGVTVRFQPQMPAIEFSKYHLNRDWSDDILIAAAIQYQLDNPNEAVTLITQDTAARLAARPHGIRTFELPDELKLPVEPGQLELENRRLTEQIARYQRSLPQLVVCFGSAVDADSFREFHISDAVPLSEDDVSKEMAVLKREHPRLTLPAGVAPNGLSGLAAALSAIIIPPEEYGRYNRELESYFARCEKFIRLRAEQENQLKRTIRFQMEVRNVGTAPADDVDVSLFFPDGFALVEEEDFPGPPEPPEPPAKPMNQMERLTASLNFASHLGIYSPPRAALPTTFLIRRTNSFEVTDRFDRIKHGTFEMLPELFLTFDSFANATSFKCHYVVRPANLPEPVEGDLHFNIVKESA